MEFDTLCSSNKTGQVTFSKKVTWVYFFAYYIKQFYTFMLIHEKRRKILKVAKEVVFV
jgi:hypothetical protein